MKGKTFIVKENRRLYLIGISACLNSDFTHDNRTHSPYLKNKKIAIFRKNMYIQNNSKKPIKKFKPLKNITIFFGTTEATETLGTLL